MFDLQELRSLANMLRSYASVTTNFEGEDVVPLQGAIAGCHCSALMVGGEGDGQVWGRGAVAGCPWHPTQQSHPEKTSRKTALRFLQTLHCSLH